MLGAATTIHASTVPSLPARALGALDRAVTWTLIGAVTVMVGVVSAQVALRYGFNLSIDWADEIGRLAFVWSIFLAVPLGVARGSHIGIDLVVDRLPQAARGIVRRAGAATSAAMMAIIAWAAFAVAHEQWDELMSTLDWSVGWFIVPVGIGAALSALHLLRIAVVGAPAAQLEAKE
jgi:TRAP-type C4-dicarboxylate transport system permease small subunit